MVASAVSGRVPMTTASTPPGTDFRSWECEVHEAYLNEQGLFEHNMHIMEARAVLFETYAFDHRMTAFGEVSQELRDLSTKHAGGLTVYSFLQGLHATAAV